MWNTAMATGLAGIAAAVAVLVVGRVVIGRRWRWPGVAVQVLAVVGLVPAVAVGGYGTWVAGGADSELQLTIGPGLDYHRLRVDGAVVHVLAIDLADPCVSLTTTALQPDGTVDALHTATWAERQGATAAINGSFFFPYESSGLNDVYPTEGEEVTALGEVVWSGPDGPERAESSVDWDGWSVWLDGDGVPGIGPAIPDEAVWAITGRAEILADGQVVAPGSQRNPRTTIAVDPGSRRMWWLVADGRQPGYSDGLTLAAAGRHLAERGATDAVEMDGGGSSILVGRLADGPGVDQLSRPMQMRVPGRSRVVANHVGVLLADDDSCRPR